MNESRLMIVAGEKSWTLAALHLICTMSRRQGTEVWLLKMIPVSHPFLLDTPVGLLKFSNEDQHDLEDFGATAEDYGITLQVQLFQYFNYWSGVVSAAEQLEATAVIVHIPPSHIPFWQNARRRWLQHRLSRQNRLLITLDEMTPSLMWSPSPTLQEETFIKLTRHQV